MLFASAALCREAASADTPAQARPAQPSPELTVTGIGGAGGMFTPAVSPVDPKIMFISCDMGGTYRSEDGGKSWTMLHWRELSNSLECRPAFVGRSIYWVSGNTLKASHDGGRTWSAVVEGKSPWQGQRLQCLAGIESGQNTVLLVGTDAGLWRSADLGRHWSVVEGSQGYTELLVLRDRAYGISRGVVMSGTHEGITWAPMSRPGGAGTALSLAGGVAADGKVSLFTAGENAIMRWTDRGQAWEAVDRGNGYNMIQMAADQTQVIYAAQGGGKKVVVSRDGGKSWQDCFRMTGRGGNVQRSWVQTKLHWGYRIMPLGLGADPVNPSVGLLSTQGDIYITRDSGRTWQQCMNTPVGKEENNSVEAYRSNGLEVTSSWKYLFDPFDSQRTYIAYTDIGFCRSLDRGQTLISSTDGCPWSNTFYEVLFDPAVKGKMYAACSTRHDIPMWGHLTANKPAHQGGVCVSDDYGAHWRVLGQDLPALPCVSLCMDSAAGANGRILYAAMYGGGVYKSVDEGKNWVKKSNGLGNKGNLHAMMVKVHPRTRDVYCSITAFRQENNFPVPGGLWKSSDGGEHWTDLTADLKLRWATGFALDEQDPNVIYLAAATAPHFPQGGLYKSIDGGAHWTQIVNDAALAATGGTSYSMCLFVTLRPGHPNEVFLSTGSHGLWISKDAGLTFKRMEALPFRAVARVSFDPRDPEMMYVATHGGGVWKVRLP
jgi:photosystem II stability/assembly factor-like uncharacterized protein